MTVIPFEFGAVGTIPKELVKGQKEVEIKIQVETIQPTALRSTRILRRALETGEDLLSLKLQWEPSTNTGVKNSHRSR